MDEKATTFVEEFEESEDLGKSQIMKKKHVMLEACMNALIEVSSMLDLISDLWILYALANSPDTAWFSFALFTMVCPYYTVYTSLMNF